MRVLKVVAEGLTTSFRYPHFMQGVQPTFAMPPPATIYGHLCSALGEWVDPRGVEFAYHFTYQGQFDDVEHIQLLAAARGQLPESREPKAVEGVINPFKRGLLFNPKLVLYLNRPEWEAVFRNPCYTVVLGRSQDLFTYTSVRTVELVQGKRAYFEHTLAPYWLALRAPRGYVVLMPRLLDYARGRAPSYARYTVLTQRVYTDDLLRFEGQPQQTEFWIDPESEEHNEAHLGLLFHSFVGRYDEGTSVA